VAEVGAGVPRFAVSGRPRPREMENLRGRGTIIAVEAIVKQKKAGIWKEREHG